MELNIIFEHKVLLLVLAAAFVALILLFLIARMFFIYNKLYSSFSKLSYVVRQDAKKYFASSSNEIVGIEKDYSEQNKKMIKVALAEMLESQEDLITKAIASGRKEADQITQEARAVALKINQKAEEEVKTLTERNIEKISYIIESVLAEYVGKNFSVQEHQEFISQALDNYLRRHD